MIFFDDCWINTDDYLEFAVTRETEELQHRADYFRQR